MTTATSESSMEKNINGAATSASGGSEVAGPEKDATTTTTATAPKRSAGKTALIMLALCLAVFLAALNSVVITVALPTIARELGASDSGYAWIGSAYLLTVAALIPFWGKVSNIFGRKPMLIIANAIFMVGSLVAALAKSLTMLIAGRAVQGLGGGGLITLVNICVGDLFSPREIGMYLGIIVNLPIDGLSLIMLTLFLNIHTPKTPLIMGLKAIDWLGSITMTGTTLMFLFGLEFGGVDAPWNSAKVICLVFGVLTYAVFGVIERSCRPSRPRCLAILAGVWTLPVAITPAVASIVNGIVIRATGRYLEIIRVCMALLSLALGLFISFPGYASRPRIIIFQIIVGVAVGLPMQALIMAIQVQLPQQDVAVGTSTLGFVRQMATAISVVIGQVIFQSVLANHSDGVRAAGIPESLVSTLSGGSSIAAADVSAALPDAQRAVYDAAVSDSMSKMWIFYCASAGIGLLASFGIRKVALSDKHVETKTGLEAEGEKSELPGEAAKRHEGSSEDSLV
ncbi:MFS general substrate transporter [Achaetomium macrosporum]|uniref:MFS general substrate transporter n=1 Tax=Achaetomium macrosporum TaxID=79813 RepID=A0AAN7H3X9_9PEZI|nr:MFS general substrate transporter [Achaetomium macrosporum]